MSDVRYILGISNEDKPQTLSNGRKAKKRKFDVTSDAKAIPKKKKCVNFFFDSFSSSFVLLLAGLAREVAALALNNPHMVPAIEPQFVERPKINRATKWCVGIPFMWLVLVCLDLFLSVAFSRLGCRALSSAQAIRSSTRSTGQRS
jgi:hypothetical protein